MENSRRQNWLKIAEILIAIFGWGLSYYFYEQTKVEREPIFVVEPARTRILDSKSVSGTPIRVLKKDGREVTSDLTSVKFFLWNQGKESIRRENVLSPVFITLNDSLGEILDFRLLKVSREITGLNVSLDTSDFRRRLKVDFRILEYGDGASGQILYEGDPNSSLLISGVIEGVREIENEENFEESVSWWEYLFSLHGIWVVMLVFLCISLITVLSRTVWELIRSVLPDKLKERFIRFELSIRPVKTFLMVLGMVLAGVLLYIAVVEPFTDIKSRTEESVIQKIPATISESK